MMGNRECRVKLKILYGCRCLLTGLTDVKYISFQKVLK